MLQVKTKIQFLFAFLPTLLLLGLANNVTYAEEIVQSASTIQRLTDWQESVTLNQFDPFLGTLVQVEAIVGGSLSGSAAYENLDAQSATVELILETTLELRDLDDRFIAQAEPSVSVVQDVSAFDGLLDFNPPSGRQFPDLIGVDFSDIAIINDPVQLNDYIGTGQVGLNLNGTGRTEGFGPGNLAMEFQLETRSQLTITYVYRPPSIDIELQTNQEDADEPTGPRIVVGNPVTWEYIVTNSGLKTLDNIVVTDSRGVEMDCPTSVLDGGAIMTCTANGIAEAGQHEYLASVVGRPINEAGDQEGDLVSDEDPSHYVGFIPPTIDIETLTNGEDADDPTGPLVLVGDSVTWEYVVTNNGSFTVADLVVTDQRNVTIDCPVTSLISGETMTCTASGVAEEGQYDNMGSVAGQPVNDQGDPEGALVTDEDPSHYLGILPPVIDIETSTNGEDADEPTGPILLVDDSVQWIYEVINRSSVTLINVAVTDDRGADPSCPQNILQPNESMRCSVIGNAEEGQYENIGSVQGQPIDETGTSFGDPVSDEDPSHYLGILPPAVDIETLTNGEDADEPTGPSVSVGDLISWEYIVTNIGTIRLENIVVTDDQDVDVACPESELEPGATMTCTASGTAEAGQYSNLGSVTGVPVIEGNPPLSPVADEDPSHYIATLSLTSLGDRVWLDGNQNGLQESEEPGIGNVTVSLLEQDGNELNSVVTDEDGKYLFEELDTGTYTILVDDNTLPSGAVQTFDADGIETAHNVLVTLDGSASNLDQDFGYALPAIDIETLTNGDDADEPTGPTLIAGDPVSWRYVVTNSGNVTLIEISVTDDQGVDVTCPQSTLTPQESMECEATGVAVEGQYENIGSVTGQPINEAGEPSGDPVSDEDPSHYIAVLSLTSLGDRVWLDGNQNGLQEGEESGIGDVVVRLLDDAGDELGNTITNDEGNYLFEGLNAGTYTILVDESTLPVGAVQTFDVDGIETGHVAAVTLDGSVSNWDLDFGYALPAIDIETLTNGEDADEPTGPRIAVDAAVNWRYVVVNTGSVTLVDILVTDDQGVEITCPLSELAPGAIMVCRSNGLVVEGPYANIGTVSGQPVNSSGIPEGELVTDQDPTHHFGFRPPTIDIETFTNGPGQEPQDADEPTGPRISVGDPVEWRYLVTNFGAQTLIDLVVFDDQEVEINCPVTELIPGGSMTCEASGVAQESQYANIGSVSGQPVNQAGEPAGARVTDEDPSHYIGVLPPAIDIETLTNGPDQNPQDADTPTGPQILVDEEVVWTYIVTNVGIQRLVNLVVTDTQGVEIACPQTELTPGEEMVCTANGLSQLGQYENIGSVVGEPVNEAGELEGEGVSDEDPSHYIGVVDAAIDIETLTNGPAQEPQDADTPTGPQILAGEVVEWRYVVTNIGTQTLADVVVTDDQRVAVVCPQTAQLLPGESITCTANGLALPGQYQNVGSVVGQPVNEAGEPIGEPIQDEDSSHYFGFRPPEIDIETLTNGYDADEPTGPRIAVNEPVEWLYVVVNTSEVTLIDIVVTDSQNVDVECPTEILMPGGKMACRANGLATEGRYETIGSVIGQPINERGEPDGDPVVDEDPTHHIGTVGASVCVDQLPDVTFLGSVEIEGDPQKTFILPDGYEFFVIKRPRPRPTHYVTVEGEVNEQGDRIYTTTLNRRERVWACAGDCEIEFTLKNQSVELGQYNLGTTFHMVMLDLNDDDRDAWWAANDPESQDALIPSDFTTAYLQFAVPFEATWYFSTDDSVGLIEICIDDGTQIASSQQSLTGLLGTDRYRIFSLIKEIYLPLLSR